MQHTVLAQAVSDYIVKMRYLANHLTTKPKYDKHTIQVTNSFLVLKR